jgi:hypothetical protein
MSHQAFKPLTATLPENSRKKRELQERNISFRMRINPFCHRWRFLALFRRRRHVADTPV